MIIRMDRMAHMVEGLFFRTLHMFSLPSVNFSALMSKWSFAVYMAVQFFGQVIALTLVTIFVGILNHYFSTQSMDVYGILQGVLMSPLYQIAILFLLMINGRAILFRMDDKEVKREP
jgi:hypothetical protein